MAYRVLAASAALLLLVSATPAVPDPAVASNLHWVFDGPVNTSTRIGDTLYVGGEFTTVAPGANAIGNVYAVSATTGEVLPPRFPFIDGTPHVIVQDGAGGYYIGGAFQAVSGTPARHLVHVLSDGTRDLQFAPDINGDVHGLGLAGSRLYLLGNFTAVGGQSRRRLAQVDATTGQLGEWNPTFTSFTATVMRELGGRLYVGGSAPVGTSDLYAFDGATGGSLWQQRLQPSSGFVSDVAVGGTRLFVSGFHGLRALDPVTGAPDTSWTLTGGCSGVFRLATAGAVLYLNGSFSTCGGQSRQNYAAVNATSGAVLPWNPSVPIEAALGMVALANGTLVVGGGPVSSPVRTLLQIDATGTVLPWTTAAPTDSVRALAAGPGDTLIVGGGAIVATGGTPRSNLAAFDLRTGALLPWAPATNARVFALTSNGAAVYVGGDFTLVNGLRRISMAALHPATGTLFPWASAATGRVRQLTHHRFFVYALGSFQTPGSVPNLARFDAATGALDSSWQPGVTTAYAGVLAHDVFYLSGRVVGTDDRDTLTAFDLVSGARTTWNPPIDRDLPSQGRVLAMTAEGDTVYLTGVFSTVNGVPRNNLAAVDRRTGATVGFDPGRAMILGGLGIAVADGRVAHITSGGASGGGDETRFTLLDGQGGVMPWNPAYGHHLQSRGPTSVRTHGNVLVATGMFGTMGPPALQGLAVFPLDGARGATNLRSERRGLETVFRWDLAATAPSAGYVVEAGATPGRPTLAIPVGHTTSFAAEVPPGTFFVRVRSTDPTTGATDVSNEIAATGGCAAAPPPPFGLSAVLAGGQRNLANFHWRAPDAPVASYTFVAGSAPGLADLATFTLGGGSTGFFVASAIPSGTYYVRVRAANACGMSAFTPDFRFTIGSGVDLPVSPFGLSASVSGGTVTLSWAPLVGAITGHALEAGSAPGLANLASVTLGTASTASFSAVPSGIYFVRVRAMNIAGMGPPSDDIAVRVP